MARRTRNGGRCPSMDARGHSSQRLERSRGVVVAPITPDRASAGILSAVRHCPQVGRLGTEGGATRVCRAGRISAAPRAKFTDMGIGGHGHPESGIRAVRDVLEDMYRSLNSSLVELIGTRIVSDAILYVVVRDLDTKKLHSTLHDIGRIEAEMPSTSVRDTADEVFSGRRISWMRTFRDGTRLASRLGARHSVIASRRATRLSRRHVSS